MTAMCRTRRSVEHEWNFGQSLCQCGEREFVDGQDESVSTGDISISNAVSKLEQHCQDMKDLAGEMIATLIIQNNKKLFDHMPPEWFSAVKTWEKKFREITKENPSTDEFDFYELKPESVFKIIDGRYDKYEGHVFVKGSEAYGTPKVIPFNAVDIYTGSKELISDTVRVKLIK